jgi:uncharacterized protein (TIGR02284 family)
MTIKKCNKMNRANAIEALNTLIEINHDRIEGYRTAAEETDVADLSEFFLQFSATSQKCNKELTEEVTRLGGTPLEGTRMTGKLHRVWMDFKALLTGKSRDSILSSCEFGDQTAIETYDSVLKDSSEDLGFVQQEMLRTQRAMIQSDYNRVKNMRIAIAV